jgi:hypothetical protein
MVWCCRGIEMGGAKTPQRHIRQGKAKTWKDEFSRRILSVHPMVDGMDLTLTTRR